MFRLISLLVVACFVAGCENAPDSSTGQSVTADESVAHAEDLGINWFDGSIDEAFAAAKAQDKPMFFYWGAVWCPPCQEIKHTVFKSQDFIEITELFVPVYLDGDTERAQAWGEKFGVQGYPTMIVFDPQGTEVTRLPGGIDIDRYNDVLELALNEMRPTAELVEVALTDPSVLSHKELEQLAYYSWGQDAHAVPEGTDLAAMFFGLSSVAEDEELRARFYLEYLLEVARSDSEDEPQVMPGDDPAARLRAILEDESLRVAGWDALAYWSDEIMSLPFLEGNDELESLLVDSIFESRFDEKLSKAEKLAGWFPRLTVLTKDDATLPEDVAAMLREELGAVDRATPDPYERQSVINQMSYAYLIAGLRDDSRELLLAELDRSASPYYFMSNLASLAERDEKFDEAIEWRRKAWESAEGEATRFQWGANYVLALVRMAPMDDALITDAASTLLSSFEDPGEMFAGRNFRVLRRLSRELTEWQGEADTSLAAFEQTIETLCSNQVQDSQASENCQALLAEKADKPAEEKIAQRS